jgi:hypothetical protein
MTQYTAAVKALLRAAGMSDIDIDKAEKQADPNLLRFVALVYPRPASLSDAELRRLEATVGTEVVELMNLRRPRCRGPNRSSC